MKLQFRSFLSGALVSALVFGTAVSALAISGRMTIEVDPINIQVNGQTFVPTDVNGKEVPVFAYQGTTYAPLRALAEAYGLEVGYDKEQNMATVVDPDVAPAPDTAANGPDYSDWSAEDEAAYQEFAQLWEEPKFVDIFVQFYCKDNAKLKEIVAQHQEKVDDWFHRMAVSLVDDSGRVAGRGVAVLLFNLADPIGGDPIYDAWLKSPSDKERVERGTCDIHRILNMDL